MGTKTVPAKPSELVILAINNLEEKEGSTSQDIVKFIAHEFNMKSDEVTPRVQEALKRAIAYGIVSLKDGKYKIQDIPRQGSSGSKETTPETGKRGGGAKSRERGRKKAAPKKAPAKRRKAAPKTSKEPKTRRGTKKCKICRSKAS